MTRGRFRANALSMCFGRVSESETQLMSNISSVLPIGLAVLNWTSGSIFLNLKQIAIRHWCAHECLKQSAASESQLAGKPVMQDVQLRNLLHQAQFGDEWPLTVHLDQQLYVVAVALIGAVPIAVHFPVIETGIHAIKRDVAEALQKREIGRACNSGCSATDHPLVGGVLHTFSVWMPEQDMASEKVLEDSLITDRADIKRRARVGPFNVGSQPRKRVHPEEPVRNNPMIQQVAIGSVDGPYFTRPSPKFVEISRNGWATGNDRQRLTTFRYLLNHWQTALQNR